MTSFLKKTAIGAVALMTLPGAIAATTTAASARNGGAIAAGVVGGLAAGAIAGSVLSNANQGYAYGAPAYAAPQPVYGGGCYFTRQAVYDEDGQPAGYRRVRVCE